MKKLITLLLLCTCQIALATTFSTTILKAVEKPITVNGQTSMVFAIVQSNGKEGYIGNKGDYFDVLLKNETTVPISIHWHGLILPNDQDGVPYVTQLPIGPGASHHYHFKLLQAGTYWMHSHYKFHEQKLMSAPLILNDAQDPYLQDKNIVVMLEDFTFKNPEKIFYDLQHSPMASMPMSTQPDLNDIHYDAYLANRKTLANPQIFSVQPGDKIRLRLINAASATNFWIKTGLPAKVIAVDGNTVKSFNASTFQLALAQRLDLEVTIPSAGGMFPILAQVEGTTHQTGIILITPKIPIPQLNQEATLAAPALNDDQERQLHASQSLSRKSINAHLTYTLSGDMQRYIWKINNQVWPKITPEKIKKGDRVEMTFINETGMSHPMHFHGHIFQVTEIDGKKLSNGPLRDTILVLPHSTKKIIFDANNPGIWMNHCHVLYHMNAGMMTTTNYLNYPEPDFYQNLIK